MAASLVSLLYQDDNEFHAAKRMMSEQLYNLQISENNAAAGAGGCGFRDTTAHHPFFAND